MCVLLASTVRVGVIWTQDLTLIRKQENLWSFINADKVEAQVGLAPSTVQQGAVDYYAPCVLAGHGTLRLATLRPKAEKRFSFGS